MNPLDFMYVCMHKKAGKLENKTFFEVKNEGYRDGIKEKVTRLGWHCTFGIAHCAMLHNIPVDDVIPILLP